MSTQTPAPPALPKKRRPILIRLLMGLTVFALVLTLLIPAFYLVEKYRGRAAWRAYETEAKARGVKLDFADFIPPKAPDSENFASIPIFEAAFRASDAKQAVPNLFKLPGGQIPKFADPVKQERIDLAAWQKYFVETKLLPAASDNAAADVLKALENFDAPLAQLREASTRPHCHFPVHWEKGFAAELPHFAILQSALKLLALRLSAHLALGDSAAAYEDFHAGLRLATATAREPSLIAGLVRLSTITVMENAVWGGLAGRQWAEPELRKIEADLAGLDLLKDYLFALGSERGGYNQLVDMLIQHPTQMVGLAGVGDNSDKGLRLYPAGWLFVSKLRGNLYFDEIMARTDARQRRWFPEKPTPSSPENIAGYFTRMRHLILLITAPVYEEFEKKYVRAATMTDHTRLACALERFRLARGAFPETLAELAPDFLPAVPSEVVNGEPYRYQRPEGGSFVLYSVGTNLRDDGGVIAPKLNARKQADWVWRYPVK